MWCSTENQTLVFRDLGVKVPLKTNAKGLYTVELSAILKAVSDKSDMPQCAENCEVVTNVISECSKLGNIKQHTTCRQQTTMNVLMIYSS